jgi:hypothetical protein
MFNQPGVQFMLAGQSLAFSQSWVQYVSPAEGQWHMP